MSRGINKAILIGNLGADPEIRYTADGNAVGNVSLATSHAWKDRATGELNEKTEWHRIVFFGRLAEIVNEYLRKGSKIYVEGRIQTRKWQDRDGGDHYTTEIIANEMQILDSRRSNNNNYDDNNYSQEPTSYSSSKPAAPQNTQMEDPGFDDDIPF